MKKLLIMLAFPLAASAQQAYPPSNEALISTLHAELSLANDATTMANARYADLQKNVTEMQSTIDRLKKSLDCKKQPPAKSDAPIPH